MAKQTKLRLVKDSRIRAVLEFAQDEGEVRAWPERFTDEEIKEARRRGFLETYKRGVSVGRAMYPASLIDEITPEGEDFLASL